MALVSYLNDWFFLGLHLLGLLLDINCRRQFVRIVRVDDGLLYERDVLVRIFDNGSALRLARMLLERGSVHFGSSLLARLVCQWHCAQNTCLFCSQ